MSISQENEENDKETNEVLVRVLGEDKTINEEFSFTLNVNVVFIQR